MLKYYDPDRTTIEKPDESYVDHIFNEKSISFWNSGGNGEQVFFDGKTEMVLTQPEQGLYFIRHDEMSPYNGSTYKEILVSESGGNPLPIPRCMLVTKESGIKIVKYYIQYKSMNPEFNWANYFEAPIDWETYI